MEGKRVLITGGSGLVGRYLTRKLIASGYEVCWLSRNRGDNGIKTYQWDIRKNFLEDNAILNSDFVIHLAGANLFEHRWTPAYKDKIIKSRTKSADLLFGKVKIFEQPLKAFISASGIAYYGVDTGSDPLTEKSPKGEGFLPDVVEAWEAAAKKFDSIGVRSVQIRMGIVLSDEGGPLTEFARPVKFWAGSPLGSGDQYISWIHIEDLSRIFLMALQNASVKGPVNAVAPNPIRNRDFLRACARVLEKPFFLPNVPSGLLRIILGKEKASVLLGGNFVVPEFLRKKKFSFNYPEPEMAIFDLLSGSRHNIIGQAAV